MRIETIKNRSQIEGNKEENFILDFFANWCGPCKTLSKTFEMISNESKFNDLLLAKINIDDHSMLASEYGVRSLPTLVFVKNKKVIKTKVGNISKNDLEGMIREVYDYEK